ncbi:hypothetical protein ACFL7D_10675 [candidate division KSB1 bacterium]
MGEYKYDPRWTIGAMVEKTDMPYFYEQNEGIELEKGSLNGFSTALSYFPSHFQRLRIQFDYSKEEGFKDKAITFQWTFLIGPHQPHAY